MLDFICESFILNLLLICMWTGGKLKPSNGPSDIGNTFLQVGCNSRTLIELLLY